MHNGIFKFLSDFNIIKSVGLPTARRIYAKTISSNLVSVVPMSMPVGTLLYVDSNVNYNDIKSRIKKMENILSII